jgi:hypothetical protein
VAPSVQRRGPTMKKLLEAMVGPLVTAAALMLLLFMLGSCAGQASRLTAMLRATSPQSDPASGTPPLLAAETGATASASWGWQGP